MLDSTGVSAGLRVSEILSLTGFPPPLEQIGSGIRAVSGCGSIWIRFEGSQTLKARGAGSLNQGRSGNVVFGEPVNGVQCSVLLNV